MPNIMSFGACFKKISHHFVNVGTCL